MPTRSKHDEQSAMVYSQPWWHVSGTPQSEESDRLDVGGNNAEKERPTTVAPQSGTYGPNYLLLFLKQFLSGINILIEQLL